MTTANAAAMPDTNWVDGKRYLWLLSPMIPGLVVIVLGLAQWTHWWALAWLAPFIVYGLIPLADWLIGVDNSNAPESAVRQLEEDRYYRAIVLAYIPLQFIATAWTAWIFARYDLAWWEVVGMVFAAGTVNGIAINTAHELGHKTNRFERWLAKITLAPVAYGHFFVEHNKGHHKNVATPDDPASSKMGETFWQFLPRTMIGSLKSAWKIERERLARLGKGAWTLQNENLQAWALTVLLYAALTAWLGWMVLPFLLAQAFYGASLLEVINYIEHYGLIRQKLPDGRYERCTPQHSWNSNHIVTNLFLYQLQRHSDHHANPTRRFQALRHFDDSPQLPSGYASMLIPAYIPALWFRQMDRLVVQHYKGDLTRANLYPPKREELLARWSKPGAVPAPAPEVFPGAHVAVDAPVAASGSYQCTDCGYIYEEAKGCPHEGFPAGTPWAQIPDDWPCPDCAVRDKVDFRKL